jgi:integrase/recombinase XerD
MKTGIPLVLPLLPEIEDAINRYIAARPQSDLSFIFLRHKAPYYPLRNSTLDYELRKLLEENGINTDGKKKGAHTLRSSLASSLLKEGIHYPVIQKALGHSSPNATKYYTKIDISRLRDCALEVPPPSGNFERLIKESGHA